MQMFNYRTGDYDVANTKLHTKGGYHIAAAAATAIAAYQLHQNTGLINSRSERGIRINGHNKRSACAAH